MQGFQEGAYDLIVASFVLHATSSLSRTLANARKLLRPGGFLVVGEGSVETTPVSSFIFGPLPGWWLGRDDGRLLSPHASADTWDCLLRVNGFSGIDTKAPDEWEDVLGVCLFVSQAVDDQICLLRSPIQSRNPKPELSSKALVLVGGKRPCVSQLLAEIRQLLKSYPVEIEVHETLSTVDYHSQIAPTAVLSLVDLDLPVFENMTEEDFLSIQQMFSHERTVLWVTSGRRSENPFANMIVGFGRTAVHETPGLNLQHLDVLDPWASGVASTIAETLLRLIMVSTMADRNHNMMWVVEPEIIVEANGRQRVARLVPLNEPNDRYNSGRRPITREIDIKDQPMALCRDNAGLFTLEQVGTDDVEPIRETEDPRGPLLSLRVTYAILPRVRTQLGHMFLAVGVENSNGSKHLLLLPRLTSLVCVPVTATLLLPQNTLPDPEMLSYLADHLTALQILRQVVSGQVLVIHNATSSLAEAISFQAAVKDARTVFTADKITDKGPFTRTCINLPPYVSQSDVLEVLPNTAMVSCFVDLTPRHALSCSYGSLKANIPRWCRLESAATLYSWEGPPRLGASHGIIVQELEESFHMFRRCGQRYPTSAVAIGLEQLMTSKPNDDAFNAQNRLMVLDLTSQNIVPVHVKRLDADGAMFKHNMTYWVVGLSGDLGISLCDWMISTGARHLVLTSRNPNIDRAWIDSNLRRGVQITIMPWYEDNAFI